MTDLFQKKKDQSDPELFSLDMDDLDGVTGGTDEYPEPEYPGVGAKDTACARFLRARGKQNSGACEGCFYYHPLEAAKGYCSR